jgi:hypothetical protein
MSSITLVWKPVLTLGGSVEYHALLLYNDGKNQYYARGGPNSGFSAGSGSSGSGSSSVPGLGPIKTEHGPYVERTPDHPDIDFEATIASWPKQNIISGDDLDLSELWHGITGSLDRMNAAHFWYGPYPFGSGTSNSVIFSALREHGFDDIGPVVCGPVLGTYACAPGWNTYLHPSETINPQGLNTEGTQPWPWPWQAAFGDPGTLDIYNGTVPPVPYLPSGLFGGGLMPSGALGPAQPNPADGGALSAPLPQTRIRTPQVPAAPPSPPFGVPIPEALKPLVPHFFPQGFDANNTQAWPSTGSVDGAGTQPNSAGSAGAGLGLVAGGQLTPQQVQAPPPSPFSVPVPPALQPLVPHFFPQGFDTNNTQAWPPAGTSDDVGTQPNPVGSAGAGLELTAAQLTPQPFGGPPAFDVPVPEALRPLLRLFFP